MISSSVLKFNNMTPIPYTQMDLQCRTLSSSVRSADQQECPSRIKRTDLPLWMRKMGGKRSQTTLVFNKRGDSLSLFHSGTDL